jgi:hypothetical protein
MPLSPPKTDPSNGVRSAWGPKPAPAVEQVAGAPPALLLPAHLAIDSESLAAVCEQVKAAIAEAVRAGVAEGFATAWPEDQPTPTAPPAAG